jgi:hypothetical protein
MENCLDPQSLALLSTAEQGKVPLLFHQLTEVRDEMRDAWLEIRSNPRNEAVVPLRNWHIDRFLIQDVPIVAQNLVDMLCHVMAHQDRFASYHAATISASVISSEAEFGSLMDRVWRTSDLKRTVTGPRTANRALFAWRNDDPTQVPEGMRVVSLSPPEGGDYSIDLGSKQRVLVLANALNLRRRRRGTKRHAESLQRRSGCS